jgi:hypothetical protein
MMGGFKDVDVSDEQVVAVTKVATTHKTNKIKSLFPPFLHSSNETHNKTNSLEWSSYLQKKPSTVVLITPSPKLLARWSLDLTTT